MGLCIVEGNDRHDEHMICIQHNIPMGNNYAKLHNMPKRKTRTVLRLHGTKKGYAFSRRRKYWQKSIFRSICVMQSIVDEAFKRIEDTE